MPTMSEIRFPLYCKGFKARENQYSMPVMLYGSRWIKRVGILSILKQVTQQHQPKGANKMKTTQTADNKIEKGMILASLAYFVSQPPRLESGNYVSGSNDWQGWRALRQERASITRDLKTAKFLLPMVDAQVDLQTLKDSFRAFSGRLSLIHISEPTRPY